MLYVTFYAVIGSRCTGTYLVNAINKREAKNIVQKFDSDYVRIQSQTEKEMGGEWEDMIDGIVIPAAGNATHIESGT